MPLLSSRAFRDHQLNDAATAAHRVCIKPIKIPSAQPHTIIGYVMSNLVAELATNAIYAISQHILSLANELG